MEGQRATYSLMALQQDLPDDLPSWAFEEDVLGGFEDFMDITLDTNALEGLATEAADEVGTASAPADPEHSGMASCDRHVPQRELSAGDPATHPSNSSTGVMRKQQKNREAQQRFRMRQRARTQNLEAQIAATSTELHRLQTALRQLEDRNALLETLATDDTGDSQVTSGWISHSSSPSGAHKTISLTLSAGNQPVSKTVQDVSSMPFTEFAALYAGYAQKLRHCLLALSQAGSSSTDDKVTEELQRWTSECESLVFFLAVGDLKKLVSFSSSRLDGQMGPAVNQLPDSWYRDYLGTLELTEEQQVDLMLLRRLFYGKLGALRRERKVLLQQVPTETTETAPDASERLATIMSAAQQLHDNSAAEFKIFMQLTAAHRRGVLTMMQQARCVVKGFPYIADKARALEVLAAMRGEPSTVLLAQPTDLDDFEHHTSWQRVVIYLKTVTRDNMHMHLPFATQP